MSNSEPARINVSAKAALTAAGVHVLCDGQYGSTGKGLFGAYLANEAILNAIEFDAVLTNAGPNSGHTFYHNGEKHVLKQLPTFGVWHYLHGVRVPIFLTAGSIIDPDILAAELDRYPGIEVFVHPNAAVIDDHCKETEKVEGGSLESIASTQTGTGAALARKVLRYAGAVVMGHPDIAKASAGRLRFYTGYPAGMKRAFMEVSQGFSLGINQPFYPHTTSRECTVAQAMADAVLSPRWFAHSYMCVRTFPIRVGNLGNNSSGDCYPDQKEIKWEDVGVEPERTTVTNRIRRVFTFSHQQLGGAIVANTPSVLLMNFMNYIPEGDRFSFMEKLFTTMGTFMNGIAVLQGFGPNIEDIKEFKSVARR